MEVRELSVQNKGEIQQVIRETFSQPPWNDDWRDETQLSAYIQDLIGNPNSLSLGLYEGDTLMGVSLGRVKHWYAGNEYWIDDLAILPRFQGHGCGSRFIRLMEDYLLGKEMKAMVLFTERNIPAYGLYVKTVFSEKTERVFFEKRLE